MPFCGKIAKSARSRTPHLRITVVAALNLPNIGDIDEALVRPGRCFAAVRMRALERHEAERLLRRLQGHAATGQNAQATVLPDGVRSLTLATLYRLADAGG